MVRLKTILHSIIFTACFSYQLFYFTKIIDQYHGIWGWALSTMIIAFYIIISLFDYIERKNKYDIMEWNASQEAKKWKRYLEAIKKELLKRDLY